MDCFSCLATSRIRKALGLLTFVPNTMAAITPVNNSISTQPLTDADPKMPCLLLRPSNPGRGAQDRHLHKSRSRSSGLVSHLLRLPWWTVGLACLKRRLPSSQPFWKSVECRRAEIATLPVNTVSRQTLHPIQYRKDQLRARTVLDHHLDPQLAGAQCRLSHRQDLPRLLQHL